SPGSAKVLRVRRRRVRRKQRIRVERVLAAEEAREEIEDAIEIQVGAELQIVRAHRMADVIDELPTLDGRLARAEIIPAQLQKSATGLNSRFGDIAVRRARFAIAADLKTKLVNRAAAERRGQ